jgi:AcrR family transcriptional regulator
MVRPRHIEDDEILAIARDAWVAEGPALAVGVIAERVGLSQAALFKRFGSKQELMLRALMPPPHPPVIGLLAGAPDARPIPDQLRDVLRAMFEMLSRIVPQISVLRAAGIDMQCAFDHYEEPPPVRVQRALAVWLGAGMEAGRIRRGDPTVAAMLLMGTVHQRAMWRHVFRLPDTASPEALSDERWVEEVVHTFWRGLAPEEP